MKPTKNDVRKSTQHSDVNGVSQAATTYPKGAPTRESDKPIQTRKTTTNNPQTYKSKNTFDSKISERVKSTELAPKATSATKDESSVESDDELAIVIGVVCAIIVACAIFALIVFVYRHRKRNQAPKHTPTTEEVYYNVSPKQEVSKNVEADPLVVRV